MVKKRRDDADWGMASTDEIIAGIKMAHEIGCKIREEVPNPAVQAMILRLLELVQPKVG